MTSVPFGLLGLGRRVMCETSDCLETEMYLHALRVDGAATIRPVSDHISSGTCAYHTA